MIVGKISLYVFSILLSCLSVASQVNNLSIALSMSEYVKGWERAKELACYSDSEIASIPYSYLKRIIEPEPKISMHPGFDVDGYWALYLKDLKRRGKCENKNYLSQPLMPTLKFNEEIYFGKNKRGVKYLMNGWSVPEPWGVWSDSKSASLIFNLPYIPTNDILVYLTGTVFLTPKNPLLQIDVIVNGEQIDKLVLNEFSFGTKVIKVPQKVIASSKDSILILEFNITEPKSPKELGLGEDYRKIGLGLISLKIEEPIIPVK